MPFSVDREDGGVAIVTLSPEASRNTFNPVNLNPFVVELEKLMDDPSCRAVVITGSGHFFSAGGPIGEFADAIDDGTIGQMTSDMTGTLHPLILKIRVSDTVFIAAINGAAAGGGLGLALSADYRVCSERAKLAAAFFALGLSPDGGTTWLLPRLVGVQQAKKFFFENQVWSAETSLEMGAVDEVVPHDDLVGRSVQIAKDWGRWSVNSRRSTKQLMDASTSTYFETQLEFERALMIASSLTPDFAEGVSAFLEKREPVFSKTDEEE